MLIFLLDEEKYITYLIVKINLILIDKKFKN